MPITSRQVVPWAAAFVGGTAAAWLAHKLAPKKYKDFLGSLGLLGGGALSYFLADKALGGVPATTTEETPATAVSAGQPAEPASTSITTPTETEPVERPSSWAKVLGKAKTFAATADPYPIKFIPKSYRAGFAYGAQDTLSGAVNETTENRLLKGAPVKALHAAQLAELPGLLNIGPLSKIPLGPLRNFIPGEGYTKGVNMTARAIDTAQILANTYADAKKGIKENYYGNKADEYNEFLDQTGWGIGDKFLFNLGRQVADKAINTAGTIAIAKSPFGIYGATQVGAPAPHIPVGEIVGLSKEFNTVGADTKENRLQGKVLERALFNDIKTKPGETPGEAFWRGLKNTARGTAKLFSGGAYGSDIYNTSTEEERLAAKPIRVAELAALKQKLTAQILQRNPDLAKDYNSTDGVKRLRVLQRINREIAPRLNSRFSF